MKQLFLKLLFGNLASKVFFIAADGIAAFALPIEQFGAFVLLQGLVVSGAILGVWGRDQAVISVTGRANGGGTVLRQFLVESRIRVAGWSLFAAIVVMLIAFNANVKPNPEVLLLVGLLIVIQAQLIVNTSALRACARAFESILYFDGLRNFLVFAAALAVLALGLGYEVLLYSWCIGSVTSLCLSHWRLARVTSGEGEEISEIDIRDARTITIFGGIWGVTRLVSAQLVVVASAYLLSPEELGVVGFYVKFLAVYTFIQTVMVQTVAPVIGKLGKVKNIVEARRVYALTTVFLAAATSPLIGASLLAMPLILQSFGITHDSLFFWTLQLVFFTHAVNIGTGIIGQFIIHFGRSRELLFISIAGAAILFAMLLTLGPVYGVDGVLAAHAVSALFLVAAKHLFSGHTIGIHGFAASNLFILGFCMIAFVVASSLGDLQPGNTGLVTIAAYLAVCMAVSFLVVTARVRMASMQSFT